MLFMVFMSEEISDLRRLALSIQFGRTEAFFGNESSNFLWFVLLHRMQESLVTLTPILTLGGLKPHVTIAYKDTDSTGQVNLQNSTILNLTRLKKQPTLEACNDKIGYKAIILKTER